MNWVRTVDLQALGMVLATPVQDWIRVVPSLDLQRNAAASLTLVPSFANTHTALRWMCQGLCGLRFEFSASCMRRFYHRFALHSTCHMCVLANLSCPRIQTWHMPFPNRNSYLLQMSAGKQVKILCIALLCFYLYISFQQKTLFSPCSKPPEMLCGKKALTLLLPHQQPHELCLFPPDPRLCLPAAAGAAGTRCRSPASCQPGLAMLLRNKSSHGLGKTDFSLGVRKRDSTGRGKLPRRDFLPGS